jgi:hypothetical protein
LLGADLVAVLPPHREQLRISQQPSDAERDCAHELALLGGAGAAVADAVLARRGKKVHENNN